LRLHLPSDHSSSRQARALVADELKSAGFCGDLTTVLLLVSELVTNATLHASPPFTLVIGLDDSGVRVEVEDADHDQPPTRRAPMGIDQPGAGGWGLNIVDSLANSWGWHENEIGGKTVWFTVGDNRRGD
jgi:anti-sigma regulatory factor (Ser/Thr protein kinase)